MKRQCASAARCLWARCTDLALGFASGGRSRHARGSCLRRAASVNVQRPEAVGSSPIAGPNQGLTDDADEHGEAGVRVSRPWSITALRGDKVIAQASPAAERSAAASMRRWPGAQRCAAADQRPREGAAARALAPRSQHRLRERHDQHEERSAGSPRGASECRSRRRQRSGEERWGTSAISPRRKGTGRRARASCRSTLAVVTPDRRHRRMGEGKPCEADLTTKRRGRRARLDPRGAVGRAAIPARSARGVRAARRSRPRSTAIPALPGRGRGAHGAKLRPPAHQ